MIVGYWAVAAGPARPPKYLWRTHRVPVGPEHRGNAPGARPSSVRRPRVSDRAIVGVAYDPERVPVAGPGAECEREGCVTLIPAERRRTARFRSTGCQRAAHGPAVLDRDAGRGAPSGSGPQGLPCSHSGGLPAGLAVAGAMAPGRRYAP